MRKFEKESKIFESSLPVWLEEGRAGLFVVIKDDNVIGFFQDPNTAFKKGIELFGIGQFFMAQVMPADSVNVSFFGLAV